MGQVVKAHEKKAQENDAQARQALELRHAIKASEQQFALALPKHVDTGRFLRASLTALNVVPKLALCTQTSVLAGLMQAAQLGLEIADVRGQAYLIPRWNTKEGCYQASFQLGFRGMIDLAARGGITVDVDEICEHDAYDYQRGTKPFLFHKPTLDDRGEAIAYYAIGSFSDGRPPSFVIMGRKEIERHRDRFASTKNRDGEIYGTWVDHFDAMSRKTVIRALLNYLPATVELRAERVDLRQAVTDADPEIGPAAYMVPISAPLDDRVDLVTGEIADPMTVIETSTTDAPDDAEQTPAAS